MSSRPTTIIMIIGLTAGAARADNMVEARQHYQNAQRAAELGEYDAAAREYSAAYHEKDDPAFLYDLGQVHRLAGHRAEAVRFYRMYLIKAPDAPNRTEVETKIAALQQQLLTAPAERPRPPTPPPHPSAATAPAAGVIAPPVSDRRAQPARRDGQRQAAIALSAVGVALAGSGIALTVVAYQTAGGVDHPAADTSYDPASLGRVHAEQGAGAATLAVGAAALVVGGILFVLETRHHPSERRVAASGGNLAVRF